MKKKFDRDKWLDAVLMDKSLSDKDVAVLIMLYTALPRRQEKEERPKKAG